MSGKAHPAAPLQCVGPLHREYVEMLSQNDMDISEGQIEVTSDDVLLVIDMQNDFLPADDINKNGGRFGVTEGSMTVPLIAQLIDTFLQKGARVVASRDYHPVDHISFTTEGGHFPPHCVQGSVGSRFYSPIGEALAEGIRKYGSDKVTIVFKGFHEDVDSFGAFPYSQEHLKVRLQHRERQRECGGCLIDWTGCRMLKCSCLEFGGVIDVDAPPDILASYSSVTLADYLGPSKGHAFVCGLALDFCVLDTALTATRTGIFKDVHIVLDASRAAYVPGVGRYGSGFLSNPRDFMQKTTMKGVKLVPTIALTHTPPAKELRERVSSMFPQSLGPLWLRPVQKVKVTVDPSKQIFTLRGLEKFEGQVGKCSQQSPCFLYPMTDTSSLTEEERMQYVGSSHDPTWELVVNGGFVKDGVCSAVSIYESKDCLTFNPPATFKPGFARPLLQEGAFHSISLPVLQAKGYNLFTWLGHSEVIASESGEKWCDWPHGAFVYLHSAENLEDAIIFTVKK
eukprot:TRINITY_DN4756_c0_g1_i1.p1 TRINITY_DN4756_c0_g1~~TRINITY_DN4756_c0_g1_i1.p1  ORF type:complete len:510 (+),score=161.45 TRINITY_DN4756_c0_g1_i1:161-1690(+)